MLFVHTIPEQDLSDDGRLEVDEYGRSGEEES